MIETHPLEKVGQAYARTVTRSFRGVLTMLERNPAMAIQLWKISDAT